MGNNCMGGHLPTKRKRLCMVCVASVEFATCATVVMLVAADAAVVV